MPTMHHFLRLNCIITCWNHRDKYMFHQANLVSTSWTTDTTDPLYVSPTPTNDASLLEYWYIRVLGELSKYLNTDIFPVQVRFPAKRKHINGCRSG